MINTKCNENRRHINRCSSLVYWLPFYIVAFSFLILVPKSYSQSFFQKLIEKNDSIDYNTEYIKSYSEKFTPRIYFSRKYTNLKVKDELDGFELDYEPNSTLNLGVGATVKSVSLSISYDFKFLNPDNNKGKTKNLDLQTHIYSRRWVIDLYAQFYTGLYLENTQAIAPDYPDPYYIRGDIYQQLLGGSALYLFNHQKFSYRAPFNQNERQLKSTGSFLLGAESNYGLIRADSALLPTFNYEIDLNDMDSISSLNFLNIGPSVGYVYSLVLGKRFFATLSLTMSTTYGLNTVHHDTRGSFRNAQMNLGAIARWATGYNDDRWYFGVMGVHATVSSANKDRSMASSFGVGNYQLIFVWRINPGPKMNKYLKYVP